MGVFIKKEGRNIMKGIALTPSIAEVLTALEKCNNFRTSPLIPPIKIKKPQANSFKPQTTIKKGAVVL